MSQLYWHGGTWRLPHGHSAAARAALGARIRSFMVGGITSAVSFAAAAAVVALFNVGPLFPRATVLASVLAVGLLLWRESRRHNKTFSPSHLEADKYLNIPRKERNASPEGRWNSALGDDPITDWPQDLIGRTSVVEVLAAHVLTSRTPIIALHGGLGDGKTSVLNLLRVAIENHSIVVSFSAWLPGSETTLAIDLFN